MSTSAQAAKSWWGASSQQWTAILREREEQVFLALTLVIGALVGAAVVAFILLTERFGARLYPAAGMGLRRLLVPVAGSLGMGYLLYRYFPDARGSGVPQTKAALYAREGNISLGTVIGKFFCTSATLASGIPLGREGPAVQLGAGTVARSSAGESEGAAPRGSHGGNCGGIQHPARGCPVFAGGSCRRPPRSGSWFDRAGLG